MGNYTSYWMKKLDDYREDISKELDVIKRKLKIFRNI